MAEQAAYRALALQAGCHAVNDCANAEEARARMLKSVERIDRQVGASKRFVGDDLRLVVVPEYFLTGFPTRESPGEWRDKAALEPDDAVWRRLGDLARNSDVFFSGNAYEIDPAFPELYFQSSFVIGPDGEVQLRYRRLISMFAPTPFDVWDRYREHYDLDAIFPVLCCELGRLACVASEEILYPEIARAHALAGAEVLLHSTSEVGSPRETPKGIAKRARALENLCYVVSANSAGIDGIGIPKNSTDGHSQLIDPQGRILVEAGPGESMVACDEIDLTALRRARGRPGMGNLLARQRLGLFESIYSGPGVQEPNSLLQGGAVQTPDRDHFRQQQQRALDALAARWTS